MKHPYAIWNAFIVQFITAIFIIVSSDSILVARLGAFYELFPNKYVGAGLMLISSFFALIGLYKKKNGNKILFYLPQWIFLVMTSGSAMYYVIQGHYADSVMRPWSFIFIDQLHAFVSLFLYSLAIFNFRKHYG